MSIAVVIMGHSDWGKSHTVMRLGNVANLSGSGKLQIPGVSISFTKRSRSNDDWGMRKYIQTIQEVRADLDLITCMCPKSEENNNAVTILETCFTHFDKVYFYLIEYSYDDENRIDDIHSWADELLPGALGINRVVVKKIMGKHKGSFETKVPQKIIRHLSKHLTQNQRDSCL